MVDRDARAARLDAYLDANGYDAVWFARPNAFAWLTGASNVVDREAPVGVAAAGYVRDGDDDDGAIRVVAEQDAGRLAAEELPDSVAVSTVTWHERSLAEAVAEWSPGNAVADFDVPGQDRVDAASLRFPLTADDVERYRALCEESAAAVERVCRELSPEDAEHEVASALRITLSSGRMSALTVLVAGGDRAREFGAVPPGGDVLGDYALVSVTTERDGLHASLTRTVAFDAPGWLHERHRAAARVEATALAATRATAADPEGAAGDVFAEVQDAYETVGHPEAWTERPQGGAAGFARREWLATPEGTQPVPAPMGYAWNPTVAGARSEDTYLVETPDADETSTTAVGLECLTATPHWPTVEVEAVGRDVTVERHGILEP